MGSGLFNDVLQNEAFLHRLAVNPKLKTMVQYERFLLHYFTTFTSYKMDIVLILIPVRVTERVLNCVCMSICPVTIAHRDM